MLSGTQSGCINHPGVEAAARCKQCSRPICGACVVSGPTGIFCSAGCKEKHETFARRAQELDDKARSSFFIKLKGLIVWLIVVVGVAFAIGFIGTAVNIPVLTPLVQQVRGIIGI